MRVIFGIVGVLVVLATVFMLVGKQLGGVKTVSPDAAASGSLEQTARQTPAEVQKQYKDALNKALEQGQQRLKDE